MYVCLCHAVTDREIHACIDAGAGSMRELCAKLKVCTQCGKCACLVRGILRERTPTELGSVASIAAGAAA